MTAGSEAGWFYMYNQLASLPVGKERLLAHDHVWVGSGKAFCFC
jgi:hypothetical protein